MTDWLPLILALVFGTLLLLVLVFLVRILIDLKREIGGVNRKLNTLEEKLKGQQKQLDGLKESMTQPGPDPLMGVMNTVLDRRNRNPWMTLGMVGLQVFRSYWNSRKTKSLP